MRSKIRYQKGRAYPSSARDESCWALAVVKPYHFQVPCTRCSLPSIGGEVVPGCRDVEPVVAAAREKRRRLQRLTALGDAVNPL
jgi:hypothetical protein